MDVAREMHEIRYRVKLKARGMALEAEARIYGMEPHAYTEAVLYAQKLTAMEDNKLAAQQTASAMEGIGEAYGNMYKAIQDIANSFAVGFQRALGA